METQLQAFLRNGGTPEQLKERFGIKSKQHGRYPQLIQFKYDQIESPMGERIVQECRGIILDAEDNWRCVARPFDKFFNHDEGHAAKIDWATARVMEKLDGSLIITYSYRGELQIATSGTPDASGEVNGCGFTFNELFRRVMREQYDQDLTQWHPSEMYTFMWELMTPYNRVVVRHMEPSIALIGVRNVKTGEEVSLDRYRQDWCCFMLPVVQEFPLQTLEDVRSTFDKMDPLAQEGYVIVDDKFNRIKVKHPGYIAIHHARDGVSPKRMLEVIRKGEGAEFATLLTHFPEWEPMFKDIQQRYFHLIVRLECTYEDYKHIQSQKEFALAVKDVPFNGALFMKRAGKVASFKDYLATVHIKHLVEYLSLKEMEL